MYRRIYAATYTADMPLRPPDWRWRRICEIIERGTYATRRHDGETVCRAVRHLRAARRNCTTRAARNRAKREPDLFMGLKVAQEATLRPLEIHARVLARQGDVAIARHVGLPVGGVARYVELFFDVRDRIDASGWIAREVAGISPRRPPSPQSLMLMSAYVRGPLVIEPWLDYLAHQDEVHDLATHAGRQRAAIELLVDVHQLCASECVNLSYLRCFDFIAEIDANPALSGTVATALLQNTPRILGALEWPDPPPRAADGVKAAKLAEQYPAGSENTGSAKAG